MAKRRIEPARLTPRARRAWRRRRFIVGGGALVGWSFLALTIYSFVAASYPTVPPAVPIVCGLIWLVVTAVVVRLVYVGAFPGTTTPYVGASCRVCRHDLTGLLPGDGEGVRCPHCGYRNRFRPPTCGTCGYVLTGVPADEAGSRTCPECGAKRRVIGPTPGGS